MKTGDKVIVPAEINGYGRDLRAIVTEIEKFAGAIFVTVIFTEPCPEACGRGGGVYYWCNRYWSYCQRPSRCRVCTLEYKGEKVGE